MNPGQTAHGSSLIRVHIVCNIGNLRTQAAEKADDKSLNCGKRLMGDLKKNTSKV